MVKTWQNVVLNAQSSKTLFTKELYVISGFDVKRIFQQKLVQNSEKRCFQLTIEQNTVLKEEFFFLNFFIFFNFFYYFF